MAVALYRGCRWAYAVHTCPVRLDIGLGWGSRGLAQIATTRKNVNANKRHDASWLGGM